MPRRSSSISRLIFVGLPWLGVVVYSVVLLWFVATTGDTGLRCVFGPRVKELAAAYWSPEIQKVRADLAGREAPGRWSPGPPETRNGGDKLTMLGGMPIANYADFIRATRHVRNRIGDFVQVRWESAQGPRYGQVRIGRPPLLGTILWSGFWFIQEMIILTIGARVVWKRPQDGSARVFYWLCVATVVAFMGGYHWAVIAPEPLLIYPFAAFIVFVPVLSLHFYLIFPRPNPLFVRHPRAILSLVYGVPTATAVGLWSTMSWSRWGQDGQQTTLAITVLRCLALGYIALSVFVFLLCLACLVYSYRRAASPSERNQVRWVLLATLLAIPPIGWLLWDASIDPARLGMTRAAWPMSIVSLLYTVAYAFSITRYKLMQAERLLNRGVEYVLVSMTAGLLYSGVLVLAAMLLGERLLSAQATLGTVVACVTAIVLLVLSGAAQQRIQKVIDRRFYKEKYKFDKAMRRMSLAVGSLVDRATLSRRLLEAASEVLRSEWGTIYLSEKPGTPLSLSACSGPEPDDRTLSEHNPLVARFRTSPETLRLPHATSNFVGSDPATDAMIALGGEVATPLEAEGNLAGLLLLGPKRSGMPYEEEELAFLGALGSVAALALRSADIQQTLESLNGELRLKVDKIAEQQRRILILQEQLSMQRRAASIATDLENQAAVKAAEGPPAGAASTSDSASKPDRGPFAAITGSSRAVRDMIQVARKVASSASAVLIRGESGTGKERLAEAIHAASPRALKPFVKVHCGALSQNLLESELFGHVKGAFTDAKADRMGRFQQADGGTLFLDEIGDINLEVQTKLLRVLQEMAFERVGSSQTITVDVRLIAATHQNLEALIRAGRFREDLFYRLNVISLRVPGLRERKEDIFELAIHFLDEYARRVGKSIRGIDEAAIEALVAHDWPGNIRELENAIERAVVLAEDQTIRLVDLPSEILQPGRRRSKPRFAASMLAGVGTREVSLWNGETHGSDSTPMDPSDELDAEWISYERQRLLDVLAESRGNKSEAARLLAMPRSTFFSKLKKHGLA